MSRIRTNIGPPCSAIYLGEHVWKTNFTNPDIGTAFYTSPYLYLVPNGYTSINEYIEDADVAFSGGLNLTGFRDITIYKSGASKPCTHILATNEFSAPYERHLSGISADTNVPLYTLTTSDIDGLDTSVLSTFQTPDMVRLGYEAFNIMRPRLPDKVSLVNFLIELKDLKSWKHVGNALARVKGSSTKLTKYGVSRRKWGEQIPYSDLSYKMPKGRLRMLKDIVKRLTGAHLEASFGVVPFVSDLVQIFTQLNQLGESLKQLQRYANRRQKRYYRRWLPDINGDPTVGDYRDLPDLSRGWPSPYGTEFRPLISIRRRYRWILRPVYHATMVFSYTLPDVSESEQKVNAFFDVLGVKADPGIIWNAIPFTFLIDWVIDVGSFLHSFARDNLPISITIHDFVHSYNYHYEGEAVIDFQAKSTAGFFPPPNWWTDESNGHRSMGQVFRRTYSSYVREKHPLSNTARVGAYPLLDSIQIPNSKQLALSGSLFINKNLGGKRTYRQH
ncbi:TPA_asm: maturation protein [ssRNA phage Gerhypos.1_13]|uniref:Maturation protein n=2 Tax=Leviviricetes TaxID=2842243 RepID=A0A8S5L2H0_9VIRU|nr:maturation protein [ssRNA phage Gerhypos.1_13]QDH87942.1 MAG: hypothetical protein H1Bulk29203_000003 [Leviviridae sp.]DAD51573.1 TPA_asm: maturation protein [ssRNA phage Gerhypos.1_13]